MIPINNQSPVKSDRRADGSLLVHSIFYTIQGEGPHAGRPAVFVRLYGCNLQCPGCDTEYTQVKFGHMDVGQICRTVLATLGDQSKRVFTPLVVITGGEPFRQNIIPLIRGLRVNHLEVQIETNGTLSPFGEFAESTPKFDVVVSPKAGKVHEDLYPFIIAYKYVLNHGSVLEKDGLPSSVLGMPAAPARPHAGFTGRIYVQPADEPEPLGESLLVAKGINDKNALNLRRAIKSAMEFNYHLCIQTHKIIGLD